MPKHIVRLVLLLAILGTSAFAAKSYFVPESFWKYGHFRASSVTEIANDWPLYKGSRSCASCHKQQYHDWSVSKHTVACEDCHGAGGRHPLKAAPAFASGADTHTLIMQARYALAAGRMRIPSDTVRLCTQCHEAIAGRPAAQPQIVVNRHAGTQQCTACHSPHAPKIVLPPIPGLAESGDAAQGKTVSAKCAACHGESGIAVSPEWPNLAGQRQAYLVAALEDYRGGARKAPIMNGVAANLSDKDIGDLAAYFSGLSGHTPAHVQAISRADADKASAEACAACHRDTHTAPAPALPRLSGQNATYLAATLTAYRNGTRQSALMSRVARHLKAADIQWLAAYYAKSPCERASATSDGCKPGASR